MKLFTNQQIEALLENGRKEGYIRDYFPIVKLSINDGQCIWLLTEIDPENPKIAYGLVKYSDHFAFRQDLDLDSLTTSEIIGTVSIDHDFKATHPLRIYSAAEWYYGELITDKDILEEFVEEPVQQAQLKLF